MGVDDDGIDIRVKSYVPLTMMTSGEILDAIAADAVARPPQVEPFHVYVNPVTFFNVAKYTNARVAHDLEASLDVVTANGKVQLLVDVDAPGGDYYRFSEP